LPLETNIRFKYRLQVSSFKKEVGRIAYAFNIPIRILDSRFRGCVVTNYI